MERSATRKMGPNDAGRVVWAKSEFSFFSCVLFMLMSLLWYIQHVNYRIRDGEVSDKENGPK